MGRDTDGLVIHFDDAAGGADTYEIEIQFAQRLAQASSATQPLQLRINATIDDTDEIWSAQIRRIGFTQVATRPVVAVNGRTWDVIKNPNLVLPVPLDPDVMDLQRASLTRMHGRGTVHLDTGQSNCAWTSKIGRPARISMTWR